MVQNELGSHGDAKETFRLIVYNDFTEFSKIIPRLCASNMSLDGDMLVNGQCDSPFKFYTTTM